MQSKPFDALHERLLRSGMAPRHARRYVRELTDHYEDAVQAALKTGAARTTAEESARTRMGSDERLLESALANRRARSMLSRLPGVAIGVLPLLVWIVLSLLTFWTLIHLPWHVELKITRSMYDTLIFNARVLPPVLGAALLILAIRQRLSLRWPLIGTAVVAALAGTITIDFSPPGLVDPAGWLGVGSSALPYFTSAPFAGKPDFGLLMLGIARGAVMLAIAGVAAMLWKRWEPGATRSY